ncbi:hypothetical protein ASPCADRAFT_205309 [Aspergillus carbonarius ITEM 5010]|uniref:Uncharacterized protein n=1 Tax=Aspergillus carbonarius (strain ITEM 5010) TaxID=602072 RepID=A0A1R3RU57_ASPC5|nr:hypothetical protein ASPCADRAFT_205309 [Aspergillus carbonarius ITEM 5010]
MPVNGSEIDRQPHSFKRVLDQSFIILPQWQWHVGACTWRLSLLESSSPRIEESKVRRRL